MKRCFLRLYGAVLAALSGVFMMLLPVGASIPQPVTGDERGGMMTVVLILLGASAVLMIAFAALSGKKGKKK